MSAGLPIVSTRVGGICEVAPEHEVAAYCPPGDARSTWREAMQSMLEPRRLAVMGQAAQNIAKRSFSIDSMQNDYETVYESILSRKSFYLSSLIPRFS